MSASSSKRPTPQKRRSSFVRRRSRKSLPPTDIQCAELHKKIAMDMPEAKRLRVLHETCIEFTLQKLRATCPAMEDWEWFEQEASTASKITLDQLDSEGLLDRVCNHHSSFLPNPENESLDMMVSKIHHQTELYTSESKTWDDMLNDKTLAAEQADSTLQNPHSEPPVLKPPPYLSKDLKKLLAGIPDLDKLTGWARRATDKLYLEINECNKGANAMMRFAENAQETLNQHMAMLNQKTFAGLEDPKTLVLGVLGAKSTSQDDSKHA